MKGLMSSKFKPAEEPAKKGKKGNKPTFKTLTSLGSCLSSDDMIANHEEEDEESKH